jgi:hypothetical protein
LTTITSQLYRAKLLATYCYGRKVWSGLAKVQTVG